MSRTEAFRENLEKQGFLVQPFRGVSMMPLLRQGRDAVRLVKPQRPLKKMDIVLFERPDGQLVLHRIIRIRNGEYYIRGDNCIGCVSSRQQTLGALVRNPSASDVAVAPDEIPVGSVQTAKEEKRKTAGH